MASRPKSPLARTTDWTRTASSVCDNIVTVPADALGPQIGILLPAQEAKLSGAIQAAFDLD